MRRVAQLVLALAWLAGCDESGEPAATGLPDAAASTIDPSPVGPAAIPAPPRVQSDPNPLELPPMTIALADHKRVFAPNETMLAGAKEGSTLVLYAATAIGVEDGAVVIAAREGSPYRVHPGYVIPVPEKRPLRMHDPVVTEWAGVLQHGVVSRFAKGGAVVVELYDGRREGVERTLKDARMFRQEDGLTPGNHAVFADGGKHRHVLLVSRFQAGDATRWLALGYGGAMTLVDEARLVPIPVKFKGREGAEVWAEWLGVMRPATIVSSAPPASFVVKFERAGQPTRTSWGRVMAPLAAAP